MKHSLHQSGMTNSHQRRGRAQHLIGINSYSLVTAVQVLTAGRTKNASIFLCGKEKPQSYTKEKPPFDQKVGLGFFSCFVRGNPDQI